MLKKQIPLFLLLALVLSGCQCKQEGQVVVCFTGDVLLDRGVRTQIEKRGADYLLDSVAPVFQSADATVVNLECPVTTRVSPVNKRFIFRADPEWMPALRQAGITHAAMANNHTVDQGYKGLEDTYTHLIANHITPIGYGNSQHEACQPVFIRRNGIEIALFNSVLLPLENWVYLEDEKGVCQATVNTLVEYIQKLKKERPECYIVTMLHWGVEYHAHPTPFQRGDAYRLIDAGTDVVIGHHPHVIQQEEIYKDKPIFYSLGNFVFDQTKPETVQSVIVQITFGPQRFSYKKHRVKIEMCKPVVQH